MPKYSITDPQSGRTVTVEGNRPPTQADAEDIFTKAGLRQAEPSTTSKVLGKAIEVLPGGYGTGKAIQEKGIVGAGKELISTAAKVSELPSNILGGILQAGQQVKEGTYQKPSFTGSELIAPQLVGAYRGAKAGISGEQTRPTVMGELPKFLGIEEGTPASLAVGLSGEILTPDLFDVVRMAKGITATKTGEKIAQKAGEKIEDVGESIALKGIRPTPSQLSDFQKSYKKSLGQFINDEELAGDVAENLTKKISSLQDEFDQIAVKSGVKIGPDEVKKSADEVIASLNKYANKSQIKAINELKDDLLSTLKETGKIDIKDITETRRVIDELIPKSGWQKLLGGDITSANIAKRTFLTELTRSITEGMKTSGGRTLAEVGKRLSPLYQLEGILQSRAGLGLGAKAVGLTDWLALGTGFATGETMGERLRNAVVGLVGNKIISNPKILGNLSKGIIETGEFVSKTPAVGTGIDILSRIGREAVTQTGESVGKSINQSQINSSPVFDPRIKALQRIIDQENKSKLEQKKLP